MPFYIANFTDQTLYEVNNDLELVKSMLDDKDKKYEVIKQTSLDKLYKKNPFLSLFHLIKRK